jgi:hypothetical protein
MKKTTDLQQQLRDLKLNLIEVQTKIDRAPSKAVEDFKVLMGYVPPGYKTTDDLKTEEKAIKNQIAFLEAEVQAAEGAPKKGKPVGGLEHEKVKTEFEKVRKKKKIPVGQRIDEILDEVADKLGKSFESTKGAFYYKPKK